jgi:uncharacterized protein YkwD
MMFADLIAAVVPVRRRPRHSNWPLAPSRHSRQLNAEALESRLTLSALAMTANEQLLIEFINRARANPQAEVNRTSGLNDLNEGLAPGTITNTPKQPLAPHQALIDAAGDHSYDMLLRDYFSHTSFNGDSPTDRARAAGYPASVGENIAWGGSTGPINQVQHVAERHQALFRSASHRQNLLSDEYREIGAGVRYGVFTYNGTNYNSSMVTEDFGVRSGSAFITGVAYSDAVVDNNFYDVGEGAAGIIIVATNDSSDLTYSTNTGAAGGYSLQVPNGTYTVTATGGSIQGMVQHRQIAVSGRNTKVDVVTTEGTPINVPSGDPVPTNGMALLGRSGGTWWQAQSTGTSLVSRAVGSWSNQVSWSHVQTADVDGDGDDDVIGRADNGRWWVARTDDGVLTNEPWGSWSTQVGWADVLVGDFNGDGRDDIAGRAQNGAWWVARSTGSEFVNEQWASWSTQAGWHFVQVGDFNGDGRDDLNARAGNGAWWIARSTGQSFVNERWGNWTTSADWQNVTTGDFNGDGRDEIIGRSGQAWWIAESTGSSFVNRRWTVWSANASWEHIRIGDVDGDGRDDLFARANGDWWVSRTASGRVVNERWGAWDSLANWEDVLVADLDRDGLADIAGRLGRNWWVARSDGTRFVSSLWGVWPDNGPWDFVFAGDFS